MSPILGGGYDLDNLEPTEIAVHFELTGRIYQKSDTFRRVRASSLSRLGISLRRGLSIVLAIAISLAIG